MVHISQFANPIDIRHRLVESPFELDIAWPILQKCLEGSDHPHPLVVENTLAAHHYTELLKIRKRKVVKGDYDFASDQASYSLAVCSYLSVDLLVVWCEGAKIFILMGRPFDDVLLGTRDQQGDCESWFHVAFACRCLRVQEKIPWLDWFVPMFWHLFRRSCQTCASFLYPWFVFVVRWWPGLSPMEKNSFWFEGQHLLVLLCGVKNNTLDSSFLLHFQSQGR